MRKSARIVTFVMLTLLVLLVVSKMKNQPASTMPLPDGEVLSFNEQSCVNRGFNKVTISVEGRERKVLWKGPAVWDKGAIIAMHGGGGDYTQWCYESNRLIKPQVDFSDNAVNRGFSIFLLDSTDDVVTDKNGLPCGKRWDATTVENRTTNVDLPFIEQVITEVIADNRPKGSVPHVFITGESAGGYMTTRAATHFDNLVTAFAPAASGDPYGTYFDCNTSLSPRESAKGAGFDRETNKQIIELDACISNGYPNEHPWETTNPTNKPPFKTFHSADDSIVNLSCREKIGGLLKQHGYPDDGEFVIPSTGKRSVLAHLWRSMYNDPILNFFEKIGSE